MGEVQSFASKAAEQVGRIAAVFTLVQDLEAPYIAAAAVEQAVRLVRHHLAEAQRLVTWFSQEAEPPRGAHPLWVEAEVLRDAEKSIMNFIATKGGGYVSVPDICQSGPVGVRHKYMAEKIVKQMVDANQLKVAKPPKGPVAGKQRKFRWVKA